MKTATTKKSAPARSAAKKTATKATTKTTVKKAPAQKAAKSTAARRMVKAKSSAAEGLRDLFVDSLKDIYWAEKALTKALPKMAKNATSENLKSAIEKHLEVTKGQIKRIEQVFESIGEKAVAKKCDAMDGLIKESEGIMEETEIGAVRDAGIIAASQKIEHYEIASYGTLRVFAEILDESEAQELLSATLEEEKDADMMLTEIAVSSINIEAAEEE